MAGISGRLYRRFFYRYMSRKFISWLLFAALCFIWGSSFFLMKMSNRGLTASQIASLRIFSASVVFIPLAILHAPRIPAARRGITVLTGIFGNLIPAFCFAIAITRIDSYLEGILNSLTPICVIVLGISFFRDKIQASLIAGVLIGFAGLCLLTLSQNAIRLDNLAYALLVVAGTLSYGLNINLVSHYLKDISPVWLTSVSLACMSIPSGLILWQQGFFLSDFHDPVIRWAIFNAVLLGIAGSAIATFLFYMLVQREGGLFASLVTYGIPFVAVGWGIIDGEPVSIVEVACLLIILAGVYLANRKKGNR